MTTTRERPRLAELATDLLAREHAANEHLSRVAPDPDAEALTIAAMANRIERDAHRRRLARAAWGLSLAAAFAVGVGATWMATHRARPALATVAPRAEARPEVRVDVTARAEGDGVRFVHDGREAPLGDDTALGEGDRVVAAAGARASIALSTGTRFAIEPGADFTVVQRGATQSFALDAGSVHVDVAKLHAGERFLVQTADAEVEVRGTSFRVTAAAPSCGGSATRVEVTEGVVVVRSASGETRVPAGERWPQGCDAPTPAPAGTVPAKPPTTLRAPRVAPPAAAAREDAAPEETSALKAQNRLYSGALASKRAGDARAAAAQFDQYLALYPDGALAESAAVQRFEVLAAFDRPRAVDAARAYLARWPSGFGREEAAALVAGGR
jgi:hypothetical protein